MRYQLLFILSGLTLLAGCANPDVGPSKGQEEVHAHWDTVRARLKYQLALDSYEAGQIKPAADYVQESIRLDPNSGQAYTLLSQILLEQGETALAADVIEKAAQCDNEAGNLAYQRGLIAERYGRFEEAFHWYQKACQNNPLEATCIVATAETLVSLGRMEEALTLCTHRWSDFERNSTLRAVAGHIYALLGRYEEAANAYAEAYSLSPEDDLLATTLASALVKSERYTEACAVLDRLNAAGTSLSGASLVDLARCHIALDHPDQAKPVLTQAVSVSPRSAPTWSLLARTSLDCQDLLTARRATRTALQLEPDNKDYALLLAYICIQQKDLQAAVPLLEKILRDYPDDLLAMHLHDYVTAAVSQEDSVSSVTKHIDACSALAITGPSNSLTSTPHLGLPPG